MWTGDTPIYEPLSNMKNALSKPLTRLALAAVVFVASRELSPAQATPGGDSPQQRREFGPPERGVYKARITPHWLTNNIQFWYRNDLHGDTKEFILVDADKGTRQRAFDHDKLAGVLAKASGEQVKADKLPFSEIQFTGNGGTLTFEAFSKSWRCDLNTYECVTAATNSTSSISLPQSTSGDELAYSGPPSPQEQTNQPARPRGQRRRGEGREMRSPDDKWTALVRDHNVFVKAEPDGAETQLSTDGSESNNYSRLEWSPDSHSLIAWRIEPSDIGLVYLVQSSPTGGGRAVMRQRPYAQAGDKFPKYEINIFDVASHKQIKPEVDRYEHEYETPQVHWMHDNRHFAWMQEDRGHQRLRVIEASCDDGSIRNLIDEKTKTFFWTAHTENLGDSAGQLAGEIGRLDLCLGDGWLASLLPDRWQSGKLKTRSRRASGSCAALEKIDEDAQQIWFSAGGADPGRDPYFVHYYRVNFDGTGARGPDRRGNGNHTIQFSPDRKFIVDTYSRVDMPPVNELRRVADGKLVCKLEEADISELKEAAGQPPEVFVAKGRDGTTDIWGIINRPQKLDPAKKYPILESIYNGPQSAYVPKSFSGGRRSTNTTEAGFILVQMDAMGTAFRSKAFHDVCWHNLADAGFPDRIAWIKAAAAQYPYMDTTRVGILAPQPENKVRAPPPQFCFIPEFYKCADKANSGCHDNRLDKASWNEQWMGYLPPDEIWSDRPGQLVFALLQH